MVIRAAQSAEGADLSRSQIEHLIDEWVVGRNAARDRMILKRRLIDGITYERLAEEFDLSVRQVKNIVYRCEDRLFSHT
jgi:DNA-directed RNA polymerase specialized sigma24 family protein